MNPCVWGPYPDQEWAALEAGIVPSEHVLKTWPESFQAVWEMKKLFEIRKDDRGFRAGDRIWLREYDPAADSYSGRAIHAIVTYVTNFPDGLRDGYVAMSLDLIVRSEDYNSLKRAAP